MGKYDLSLDNVFFFDAQLAGRPGKEFLTSIVWLHNFQWGSWTRKVDSDESLISHWENSDALVSFDADKIIMPLVKSQFNLKDDVYINLVDYCDAHLPKVAKGIGISYPAKLDNFKKSNSSKLWIEFVKGSESALNTRLFFSAWNTNLIYQIFFKICGSPVPHDVFIPWELTKKSNAYRQKTKTHQKDLYDKLKRTYHFDAPSNHR